MVHTSFEAAVAHLRAASVIAVLGAHTSRPRPAHYVPDYLYKQGFRILPVNPRFMGETLFGEEVAASLRELDIAVDIVDVFRRSADVPGHLDDILAMRPLPKVVWLQSGIRHDETAARLERAGIAVVQDRCALADHRRASMLG